MLNHISSRYYQSLLVKRAVYICGKTSFSSDSTVKTCEKVIVLEKAVAGVRSTKVNVRVATINYIPGLGQTRTKLYTPAV